VEYFFLLYRLNAQNRYLIWVSHEKDSNEKDAVVVDAAGFIPTFEDPTLLRQYADLHHYHLRSEEPILHDLDWVAAWTKSPDGSVNCEEALAAWNLFGDVAESTGKEESAFKHLDSQFLPIYKKLFWGNNLPSTTPEGKQYIPSWSSEEIISLQAILTAGLDLFESCTRT
jgi:hypothetical protein